MYTVWPYTLYMNRVTSHSRPLSNDSACHKLWGVYPPILQLKSRSWERSVGWGQNYGGRVLGVWLFFLAWPCPVKFWDGPKWFVVELWLPFCDIVAVSCCCWWYFTTRLRLLVWNGSKDKSHRAVACKFVYTIDTSLWLGGGCRFATGCI